MLFDEPTSALEPEMLKEVFSDAVSLLDEGENSDEALYKAKNQGNQPTKKLKECILVEIMLVCIAPPIIKVNPIIIILIIIYL